MKVGKGASRLTRLLSVLLCVVLCPPLAAASLTQLRVFPFDTHSGLPQNTVTALHADDNGLIWIGTQEGVALANGEQLLLPTFLAPLSGRRIQKILNGSAGRIVVLTEHTIWTFSIDYQLISRQAFPKRLLHDAVYAGGKLWLASSSGVDTLIFSPTHNTWHLNETLMADEVFVLSASDQEISAAGLGHLWLWRQLRQNGWQRISISVSQLEQPLNIWRYDRQWCVADLQQTFCVDDETVNRFPESVRGGVVYRGKRLFATSKGIFEGRLGNWRPFSVQMASGARVNRLNVMHVLVDDYGGIWLGTFNHGLLYQSPHSFIWQKWPITEASRKQSFSYDVTGITPGREGWWVATRNAGLLSLDEQGQLHSNRIASQLKQTHLEDVNWLVAVNQLWVSVGGQGLHFYCQGRWHHLSDMTADAPDWVFQLYSNGRNLWAVGIGGVWRFLVGDDCQLLENIRYRLPDAFTLPSERFSTIALDGSGRLWAGGESGIFYWPSVADVDKGVWLSKQFSSINGLDVHHIAVGPYGDIWLATNQGIKRLIERDKSWWVDGFEDVAALHRRNIYAVFPNSNGRLWVGTSQGVQLFDPTLRRLWRPKISRSLGLMEINPKAVLHTPKFLLWGTIDGVLRQNIQTVKAGRANILLTDGQQIWRPGQTVALANGSVTPMVLGAFGTAGMDVLYRVNNSSWRDYEYGQKISLPTESREWLLAIRVDDPVVRETIVSNVWQITHLGSREFPLFKNALFYNVILSVLLLVTLIFFTRWRRRSGKQLQALMREKAQALKQCVETKRQLELETTTRETLEKKVIMLESLASVAELLPEPSGCYASGYRETLLPARLALATTLKYEASVNLQTPPIHQLLSLRIHNRQQLRLIGRGHVIVEFCHQLDELMQALRGVGWQQVASADGEWFLFHESRDDNVLLDGLANVCAFYQQQPGTDSVEYAPIVCAVGVHIATLTEKPIARADARLLLELLNELHNVLTPKCSQAYQLIRCPMPLSQYFSHTMARHLPFWLENGKLVLKSVSSKV
ncbi:MAG: hypothetical protein D6694_01135 [Gammaproteobacteria bacterium]|nr:MAG: hypothetical protein D6694_01135 [Gammaproteobacteria bacterium]